TTALVSLRTTTPELVPSSELTRLSVATVLPSIARTVQTEDPASPLPETVTLVPPLVGPVVAERPVTTATYGTSTDGPGTPSLSRAIDAVAPGTPAGRVTETVVSEMHVTD